MASISERGVGRPKKHPYDRDVGAYVPDPTALRNLVDWVYAQGSPQLQARFEDEREFFLEEADFYNVTPITFNDPRCCEMVVRAMANSRPHTYLRASEMAPLLQQRYYSWFWDVPVLGRILAGVRATCVEVYVNDKRYVDDADDAPVAAGRDSRGRYYVVDHQGGNEGRLWLGLLRRMLHERGKQQQYADMRGDFGRHKAHDTNAGWMASFAPDPARSKEGFLGQLGAPEAAPAGLGGLPALPRLHGGFARRPDDVRDLVPRPAGEQP